MTEELPERTFRPGLHRFKVLARHLPQAESGGTWLDLGGGAGEFSRLAMEQGYEVTLVDGDSRNIANVAEWGIHGVSADLNAPLEEFRDASFDGLSLIEVVEHVPMAEGLVREAVRILKPGGVLLLSTPNAVWWRERLRMLFGRPLKAEGYHYRFFTVAQARALCTNAGLEIMHTEFSTPAFGLNWINRRLLKRSERRHVRVPPLLAGLFAQTVYVVGKRP
jgi:2-polyprenyl-3-methyl-5-hydroxy-6-metoxy-1,4-benzoquinol methylase